MNKSRLAKVFAEIVFMMSLGSSCLSYAAPDAVSPEAALRKAFPNVTIDSIGETAVKGMYEVVSGQNVFYYYPEKELLFFGDIVTLKGKNLTAEKKGELSAKRVQSLPLDKAVKIGNGKAVVIEFTDPDCPYCKKAYEFLKNRTDVTHYLFFSPFAHPAAINKIHYILNAEDKTKAYHEMFEGGNPVPPAAGYSDAVKKLAQEHMNLARSVGVSGTPTFFINGKQVVGADIQQIEQLLKDANSQGK